MFTVSCLRGWTSKFAVLNSPLFSVIVIYHSQGGVSVESKKLEQNPLLTGLSSSQVNSAAYIVWLISFRPNAYSKISFADVYYFQAALILDIPMCDTINRVQLLC